MSNAGVVTTQATRARRSSRAHPRTEINHRMVTTGANVADQTRRSATVDGVGNRRGLSRPQRFGLSRRPHQYAHGPGSSKPACC